VSCNTQVTFDASAANHTSAMMEGTLTIDSASLRNALRWTGQPPPGSGGFGRFALKARANVVGPSIALTNVNVELDGNAAEGVMTYVNNGRHMLQATLAAYRPLLARDRFLPHQFAFRGDRLAFSVGIIVLAVLASKLAAQRSDCAPLAGKSTLNRLELSQPLPSRYHKISYRAGELERLLAWAAAEAVPVGVVGSGSNLLVADDGVPGLVIKLDKELSQIELEETTMLCGGGARLPAVPVAPPFTPGELRPPPACRPRTPTASSAAAPGAACRRAPWCRRRGRRSDTTSRGRAACK